MNKENVTTTDVTPEEFEVPELAELGNATDLVQGIPLSGWDYRGMAAPSFEFESDEE